MVGGIGSILTASIIGTAISYTLSSNIIYSAVGGALTALPRLAIAINKFSRSRGVYKYKPLEEAVFAPIRWIEFFIYRVEELLYMRFLKRFLNCGNEYV